MKAIYLIAPLLAACAIDEPTTEITLESPDDKADGLHGRRVAADVSYEVGLYTPEPTRHAIDVRLLAADKVAIETPRFTLAGVEIVLEDGDGAEIDLAKLI